MAKDKTTPSRQVISLNQELESTINAGLHVSLNSPSGTPYLLTIPRELRDKIFTLALRKPDFKCWHWDPWPTTYSYEPSSIRIDNIYRGCSSDRPR